MQRWITDPIEVLVIEDNPADRLLIVETLESGSTPCRVRTFEDGIAALEFLSEQSRHPERSLPGLILLDLNLPKQSGREVLEKIKSEAPLRNIPVVILTSSEWPGDILSSYSSGANSYVVKAFGLENFIETIKSIEKFWLSTARLPQKQ